MPSTTSNIEALSIALRVSESRYRRLFETAQDGILLLKADTAQIWAFYGLRLTRLQLRRLRRPPDSDKSISGKSYHLAGAGYVTKFGSKI